jgi:DNA polymerase-3 subunit delta'
VALTLEGVLPWHEAQWRQVRAWRDSGRMPHAVLLTGQRGLGKQAFARRLAQMLLCHRPPEPDTPCGTCPSCRTLGAGAHPDYREVLPEEPGKPIRVDAIRNIAGALSLRSGLGGRKVVLIAPAEAMNRNAANAILKTLEEPLGDIVLLLVAHHPGQLPATVRSRCQRLPFRAPAREVASSWLASRLGAVDDAERLTQLAGGAPLAALALAEGEAEATVRAVEEGVAALLAGEGDPIAVSEGWRHHGAAAVCRWCWHLCGDRARTWVESPEDRARPLKPGHGRPKAGARGDIRVLFQIMDFCLESRRALEGGVSVNEQLVLDTIASLWARAAVVDGPRERSAGDPP